MIIMEEQREPFDQFIRETYIDADPQKARLLLERRQQKS